MNALWSKLALSLSRLTKSSPHFWFGLVMAARRAGKMERKYAEDLTYIYFLLNLLKEFYKSSSKSGKVPRLLENQGK